MSSVNDESVQEEKNEDVNVFEQFGKFQTLQYFWIILSLILISMIHINYVFVAENIDYRCKVPECENLDSGINPAWWPIHVDSKCYKPILRNDSTLRKLTCTNASFSGETEKCYEWKYKSENSISYELNLACQPWKLNLVGGVHNAGMVVSMVIAGWFCDKFGRKPTLITCSVGASIGVFKIFLKNYYMYILLEFIESVLGAGLFTVGIILLNEVGGRSKRVITGIIFSCTAYTGDIIIAILALTLQHWKWLIVVIYTPLILIVSYVFLLKESTRWQMVRGDMDGAKKTFMLIAKMNKLNITAKEVQNYDHKKLRSLLGVEKQTEKESIRVIMGSKVIMTRVAVTSFCFFTSSFLYYGLLVHCALLPGNKHINFILAAVMSIPGELIAYFSFNKCGRKITLQCAYFWTAVFLIAQNYSAESLPWLKVLLFLFGKVGVVICFTGIFTYSLEMFPTSVRGTLLGCGNTAVRIGSILSPLSPLLIIKMKALPSILFATTAITSALLLAFTPETKALPMFDTIEQIEQFKKENRRSV